MGLLILTLASQIAKRFNRQENSHYKKSALPVAIYIYIYETAFRVSELSHGLCAIFTHFKLKAIAAMSLLHARLGVSFLPHNLQVLHSSTFQSIVSTHGFLFCALPLVFCHPLLSIDQVLKGALQSFESVHSCTTTKQLRANDFHIFHQKHTVISTPKSHRNVPYFHILIFSIIFLCLA